MIVQYLSFLSIGIDQLKEKKDIERSIKNYILNTSNSLSSKRELVNFLFTNTTTSNNTNNINTNYKEVLIFCFEQLLTSITSQKQIDSSSFYSLFTNYLSFLFSSSTTNIILVQNALSLFVNILQKFTEENPQLLDKNAIRKIIVLLWERGVSDCIAKNERIGKEWFCKVEELLLLSQMTEEICEIKKNISLCEYSLGNYKEAIVKSKEAIQLGCSKMEAEFVLFASLVKLGKKEEAITEMINAINGISITTNSNNSNYNNFHTNNNEMEIEEIKEIDTNETNENNNEIHQIQKENTPQEKIEYIESCCYLCEEVKEKEISILALKQLLSQLSILNSYSQKQSNKSNQYKGLGMILLRELLTKSSPENELEILQLYLSQFQHISSFFSEKNEINQSDEMQLLIGFDKGEIEWNLASLYNLSKRSYCSKEYEKCFLSTIIYHIIVSTQQEYKKLYENNTLIALLGLASKIELLLSQKSTHLNTINKINTNENEHQFLHFLQQIIQENLTEIKRISQSIDSHHPQQITQNDSSKLEITFLLLQIKYAMVIDNKSTITSLTQKLVSKDVNASILELIGMSLLSFSYQNDGIFCLKSAISQLCKNPEIDGIRLSRLLREIICQMENETTENAEYEITEIISKAMTIVQNTSTVYPLNEIEWIMAWCWNKGNKWRYLNDKQRALEWYSKALFFIGKVEKKKDLQEKLLREFTLFQSE